MPKLKQILAGFLALAVLLPASPFSLADTDFEPYEDTFIISAYYSPLPDQRVYFRGSFEADKALNGNGTNGADGTQVYPGMIAAPKTYSFGTKLAIPGMGVGAIHDRGGAIVPAGERGFKHDRLDVWMGKGEQGLARALQWGVRTVTVKVYPASYAIAENFSIPGFSDVFVADLKIGDSGETVKTLQAELKTYGYYQGNVTGSFDEATKQALTAYQLARNLVASANDSSAGMLSGTTRESFNSEAFRRSWKLPQSLLAKTNATSGSGAAAVAKVAGNTVASTSTTNSRFSTTLSEGDKGDLVREMQTALTEVGSYECEINGIYDSQTKTCVLNFQKAQGVVTADSDNGAGVFGEKTRSSLATVLVAKDSEAKNLLASAIPSAAVKPGDAGDAVKQLQTTLKQLGYLSDINGNYDTSTQNAVIAFQIAQKIISTKNDSGAGFFGPKTSTALKSVLTASISANPELPVNPKWNRTTYVAYTPAFSAQLGLGDSGEEVKKLQASLKKLGYYTGEETGSFDTATEVAVAAFQVAEKVVASTVSSGAGSFGPKTIAAMNSAVKRENVALSKKVDASA
jgi:peptidoglycan hydrolase-like protein with peptidoglycan-binding domain/3D (Asp-Asp-Asp) domain-containing protein